MRDNVAASFAVLLWAIFAATAAFATDPAPAVAILELPSGITLEVEIADDELSREKGLMFRSESQFQPHQAMIFPFEEPEFLGFWMKNMNFPIDILWLSRELQVVHIEENVPPCSREPCRSYRPMQTNDCSAGWRPRCAGSRSSCASNRRRRRSWCASWRPTW